MSTFEPRRPRLLVQNRKLRHLKGLSLRNLSFEPPHLRTTDDVSVANKTPNKLEVLREGGTLQASRSSGSLRRDSLHSIDKTARPKPSRRTSLGSAHANPTARQKVLEDAMDATVGDVFFSLHVGGTELEPVYISEVRERSADFNFQFFDLSDKPPAISRSCKLIVRLWSKRPKQDSWTYLLEELIDLRKLNFIGTLLDRRFPPNALIIHLEDGAYSFDFPTRIADPRSALPITTSSYNALMKLANLENSIDDAIETQRLLMREINEIIDQSPIDESGAAGEEMLLADKYVVTQRRINLQTEKRRDELRASLASRRDAIARGREAQLKGEQDIEASREKLRESNALVEAMDADIRGQRRRICSELADIFPITPIPNAPPLSFQICNVPLTNSIYDSATARTLNEDILSAGLGFVALVTSHLRFYLSHPLPYAITHYGSQSFIKDDISHLENKQVGRRDFPLFLPRGGSTSGQWRFEYGWFLLNKDIEALCASQGLRVVDIRHTLANLKFLLYVCSAGRDEMPERKKGGVRGLWAGHLKNRTSAIPPGLDDKETTGSASSSRPGSADSENFSHRNETLRNAAMNTNNSNGNAAAKWDTASGDNNNNIFSMPFDENGTTFTLRTKGLRENVAR